MPTYTYKCTKCDHQFDLFHSIKENGTRKCPVCGGEAVRQVGMGIGLIFKGSGFYITDYKNGKNESFAKPHHSSHSNNGSNGSAESKKKVSAPEANETKTDKETHSAKAG